MQRSLKGTKLARSRTAKPLEGKKATRMGSLADRTPWRRATGEFALIVIGVLVALGLESWWRDIGDRRDEVRYLAALQEELSSNLGGVEQSLANRARAQAALATAIALLEARLHADSAEAFIQGLMNGSVYESVPLVNDAVFQDLNTTGSFRLIRDDELRRGIRYEYGRLAATWTRLARAQLSLNRGLGSLVARHVPQGVLRRPTPLEVFVSPPGADLGDVAQAIARDPMLQSEINLTAFTLESELGYLNEAQHILQEYQVLLDSAAVRIR